MIETEDIQKSKPVGPRLENGRAEIPASGTGGGRADKHYELVLKPQAGWIAIDWREMWEYRELLMNLINRDITIRYKQTVLGPAWAVLQPVLMMVIFTVVFSRFGGIDKNASIPYPVIVYAGLIPWTLFSQGMPQSALSLVNQQNMLSKVYFPRLFMPVAAAAVFLVDLVISLGIYAILLAFYRVPPSWQVIFVPVLVLLTLAATLGMGISLSALTVFYRDFKHVVPFMIQLLMYVSPVIYEASMLPWRYQIIFSFNPLFGIIAAYRSAILGTPWNFWSFGISTTVAIALLIFPCCISDGPSVSFRILPERDASRSGRGNSFGWGPRSAAMSRPIIECDKLSKRYNLGSGVKQGLWAGANHTLRDTVSDAMRGVANRFKNFGRSSVAEPREPVERTSSEFWALRDVSFEIERGEVIGIVGRNGAGKSTLLKVLSRIVEPTFGTVKLRGRSASLLEVGTGFHPELTGRENIYLNGAILGMSRAEVTRKFDEIVAFSEIDTFLDTPVKRYSSGMYVRLAFAVAAHLEPEILIVDEVLAVGDFAFQKKCLGKMNDVATKDGRTILFISHHMAALTNLCNRGILLEKGRITDTGPIRDVVKKYLRSGLGDETCQVRFPVDRSKKCQFLSVALLHGDGIPASEFSSEEKMTVRVEFEVREWESARTLTMTILTLDGVMVVYSDFRDGNPSMGERLEIGLHTFEIPVAANLLAPATYVVNLHCVSEYSGPIEERFSCCEFSVRDLNNTKQNRPGILGTNFPWGHQHEVLHAGSNGASV